jgi:ribosome modulation factor
MTPYDQGHYAGYHGESEDSNPYEHTEENYWSWYGGYLDGQHQAGVDNFT